MSHRIVVLFTVLSLTMLAGCGPDAEERAKAQMQTEQVENYVASFRQQFDDPDLGKIRDLDGRPLIEIAKQGPTAVAPLSPTLGNTAEGWVIFSQEEGGVRIQAEVENLEPGKHGFHIHENGDCSAGDASSAGGHYNPTDAEHAGPDADERHLGDLGNLKAEAAENADEQADAESFEIEDEKDAVATYNRSDSKISLSGDTSIIGRSVIVHGGEDDLESQPSGAAGPRLACGVIQLVKPPQIPETEQPEASPKDAAESSEG